MLDIKLFIELYRAETGVTLTEDEAREKIRKATPLLAWMRHDLGIANSTGARIEDTFLYGK